MDHKSAISTDQHHIDKVDKGPGLSTEFPGRGVEEVLDLKRFDVMLEKDISGYEGEFSDLIHQAPAFYRMMTRLLDDKDLPRSISPHIIAAIAYFILPEDIIPEDKFGPVGYVDDIYLCAFVANEVVKQSGSSDIITRNWDGNRPVIELIKEILDREKELLGNKKEHMMQYIGFDEIQGFDEI